MPHNFYVEKEFTNEQREWVDGVVKLLKENNCKAINFYNPYLEMQMLYGLDGSRDNAVNFAFDLVHPKLEFEPLRISFSGEDLCDHRDIHERFKINDRKKIYDFVVATVKAKGEMDKYSTKELEKIDQWFFANSEIVCEQLKTYEKEFPYKEVFGKEQEQTQEKGKEQ